VLHINSLTAINDYSRPPGSTPLATKVDMILSLPIMLPIATPVLKFLGKTKN